MVLATIIVAGCASGADRRPTGASLDLADARVRVDIERRLAGDDRLDASNIRVRVEAGVAILEGHVPATQDVRRALQHAGRADGVRQVVNRLLVIDRSGWVRQEGGCGWPALRSP